MADMREELKEIEETIRQRAIRERDGADRTAMRKMADRLSALAAQPATVPEGEVVVTRAEDGEILMVSRQDEEGRILSVIATTTHASGKASPAMPNWTSWPMRKAMRDKYPAIAGDILDDILATALAAAPSPAAVKDSLTDEQPEAKPAPVGGGVDALSPPAYDGSHVGIEDRPDLWPAWVHRVVERACEDAAPAPAGEVVHVATIKDNNSGGSWMCWEMDAVDLYGRFPPGTKLYTTPAAAGGEALALNLARRVTSHLDDGACDTSKMPEGMGHDLRALRDALDAHNLGFRRLARAEGGGK